MPLSPNGPKSASSHCLGFFLDWVSVFVEEKASFKRGFGWGQQVPADQGERGGVTQVHPIASLSFGL